VSSLNILLQKSPRGLKSRLQKTDSTRYCTFLRSIFDKCVYNRRKLKPS